MEAGLASRRKVTDLFSNFTSTPFIGVFKINFQLKLTLKAFNISIRKPYFFSISLLENLMLSLVTVLQVLTATQIRNAP